MRRAPVMSFVALLALLAAGCGGAEKSSDPKLTVATTVAPVTDIVRQVVGDQVKLGGLIPEGVDSHTFEPSPSTVKAMAEADVLFAVGLGLESGILEQAEAAMPSGSTIVRLGDRTLDARDYVFDATFPSEGGDPNPHLWMDPLYARRWAELVRDTMVERDPADSSVYEANAARFMAVIDDLDPRIRQAIESIPPAHRKLLTYHDSFAYFARRYGIPVIAAIQPSDFSEPSAREVQEVIAQVRREQVPAVFGSEVFPSKVLEQVARESGARYVADVRDDALPGPPGSPGHTYVGMMVADVTTITEALGGDPAPLDGVPTRATWQA
ncbi:MAG: metal ABC transporter substrate-binding protein [Actinomycetota bacterium]|nr:metal ABC transporter substrate-binding protein [Actinomycetota bacterium]